MIAETIKRPTTAEMTGNGLKKIEVEQMMKWAKIMQKAPAVFILFHFKRKLFFVVVLLSSFASFSVVWMERAHIFILCSLFRCCFCAEPSPNRMKWRLCNDCGCGKIVIFFFDFSRSILNNILVTICSELKRNTHSNTRGQHNGHRQLLLILPKSVFFSYLTHFSSLLNWIHIVILSHSRVHN